MTAHGYRGRFAPSPTGELHLGLLRTALLAWLRARSEGGAFVLRIEDLDAPRVVRGSRDSIIEQLRWAGLNWDEGPDVGGPHAPYEQSQRQGLYSAALAQLEARGLVYACTCTRRELGLQTAPHGLSELGPAYPGTCRDSSMRGAAPFSVRFRMPEGEAPPFQDGVYGEVSPPVPFPGDFVVRRADGLFSYQFAVVVDDIAMNMGEILRGDDLLSSTPWQLALYDGLGAARPRFAHVPLLLGPDGARLSKRSRATGVNDFRKQGATAEQLVGLLAHSAGLLDKPTPARASELVAGFSLARLTRKPALLSNL